MFNLRLSNFSAVLLGSVLATGSLLMPLSATAADDPHAVPATKPVAAKAGNEAPTLKDPKPELKPEFKAEIKPGPTAESKGDGRPTATPQEVAARIAKKVALMRAERAEKSLQEFRVRRPVPARKTSAVVAKASFHGDITERHETHWSYGGEGGPIRWGEMNPEWAKCGTGARQSPIDIRSGIKVDLEPIAFDYKPTGFNVIDTGHTIQVNLGNGNYITVGGRMFELLQFHFHRPSEEKINGRAFDMVMHLVHRDSAGKLAVVAILIERGAARKLVQTVWNNLPLEKNELVTPSGALDMNEILPAAREYFTYMGSLTTPPCSEGVLWLVMKAPVSVSPDQSDIFARLYPMNARPIQASSDRMIKESNQTAP